MTPTPTKAGRVRRAEQLLEGARNDDVRCLAHGHSFDDDGGREPVVVEKVDGKLEVWCRQCANYYDEKTHLRGAEPMKCDDCGTTEDVRRRPHSLAEAGRPDNPALCSTCDGRRSR